MRIYPQTYRCFKYSSRFIRHTVAPLAVLIISALWVTPAAAQSSVWEVTDGENRLFLGGTVHILRDTDFPLPEEFETAYQQSDSLVFEVAPKDLEDPSVAIQFMTSSTYKDGRTLEGVLSEEAFKALADYCRKANIPIEAFRHYRVGSFLMFIALQEYMKMGFTDKGVESYFETRALEDDKTIGALETAEFQIKLITDLGEGIEDEMVLYTLKDLDQMQDMTEEMITAWRTGDMEALNELMITPMAEFPEVYDPLMKNRNLDWIPKIEAMLETPPTEFILVGAGHMPGEHGVIPLLEAKGYTVTPVVTD